MDKMETAVVADLWIKPAPGAPMQAARALTLVARTGIAGDANASPRNPRQVLVVRAEDRAAFGLAPGALRENVAVAGLSAHVFAPGALLRFGGGAALRLLFHCEPCHLLGGLLARPAAIAGRRGILALVLESGAIAAGAAVSAAPGAFPALPDLPAGRVHAVIAAIPPGRAMAYPALLRAAGLCMAYARAMPAYLRGALAAGLPAHRVVDSRGGVPPLLPGSVDRLRQEGALAAAGPDGRPRVREAALWTPDAAALFGAG